MVWYCVEIWPREAIQVGPVHWPWYGSREKWMCVALNKYVNARERLDDEEVGYAACWLKAGSWNKGAKVFRLAKEKEREENVISKGMWDPLDRLLPPLLLLPPAAPTSPNVPSLDKRIMQEEAVPCSPSSEAAGPSCSSEVTLSQKETSSTTEGPYCNTKARTVKCDICDEKVESLFPLREVPMVGGERGNRLCKCTSNCFGSQDF